MKDIRREIEEATAGSNEALNTHIQDKSNPHQVTKEQVGLGNVNNTSDLDKPISNATQKELDKLDAKIDKINTDQGTDLSAHLRDFSNPHKVTKEQIGLGNVDNTADLDKPVSNATQELVDNTKKELEEKINNSGNDLQDNIDKIDERVTNIENSVGAPDGIATLDSEGKLEVSQIPNEALNVIEGKYMTETQFTDS